MIQISFQISVVTSNNGTEKIAIITQNEKGLLRFAWQSLFRLDYYIIEVCIISTFFIIA